MERFTSSIFSCIVSVFVVLLLSFAVTIFLATACDCEGLDQLCMETEWNQKEGNHTYFGASSLSLLADFLANLVFSAGVVDHPLGWNTCVWPVSEPWADDY